MPDEKTEKHCPRCGSDLVISVANQRHCNSCGHDYAYDRNPIATQAANRKARRSRECGWPMRAEAAKP